MDDEKPDTRRLVLKPKEIEPMDRPAIAGDGTAISVKLIHRENREASSKPLHQAATSTPSPVPVGFKMKEVAPLDPPAAPGDEGAISVTGILLENSDADQKSGWYRLKHRVRRRSKKHRDFLIVIGGIDLAIGFAMWLSPNPVTTIFGLSAITLLTSTSSWIIFVVG